MGGSEGRLEADETYRDYLLSSLRLLVDMNIGRRTDPNAMVRAMFPFGDLIAYLQDPTMPHSCKALFADMLVHVYVAYDPLSAVDTINYTRVWSEIDGHTSWETYDKLDINARVPHLCVSAARCLCLFSLSCADEQTITMWAFSALEEVSDTLDALDVDNHADGTPANRRKRSIHRTRRTLLHDASPL